MRLLLEPLPVVLLLALIAAVVVSVVVKIVRKPPMRKLIWFFTAAFLSAAYVFLACGILFSITRFGIYGDVKPYSGNYVPFRTIMEYAGKGNLIMFFNQVAGNILVTLPLPFVVWFYLHKQRMKWVCLISLIITAAIEPVQILLNIFIGGPTNIIDVDDLILNIVGCALGLLLLKVVNGIRKRKQAFESVNI